METKVDYTDRSSWPAAMLKAEAIIREQDVEPEGLIIIQKRHYPSRDLITVAHSTGPLGKTIIVKDGVDISEEEFQEYRAWFNQVLEGKAQERHAKVSKALQEAGYYQKGSAGLSSAYKIYDLLLTAGYPMGAKEILAEEKFAEERAERLSAVRLASLGKLAGEDGKMKITARLALARLVEVGLIQAKGKTRSRVYWIA